MLFASKGRKKYEKLNSIIDNSGACFPEYSKIKHFDILSDGKLQYVFICSCENRILNQTMGRPICPKEHAIERKNNFSNFTLKRHCDNCIHQKCCDSWAVEVGLPFANAVICEYFLSTDNMVKEADLIVHKSIFFNQHQPYLYECKKCGNYSMYSGKYCSNCGAKFKVKE